MHPSVTILFSDAQGDISLKDKVKARYVRHGKTTSGLLGVTFHYGITLATDTSEHTPS